MRFVLSLGIFTLLSSTSWAAPWDIVPLASDDNVRAVSAVSVQKQRGGSSNNLNTLSELDLSQSTHGLGKVSAITISPDGTLYTADKNSGRIWSLADRRQDGKIDLRRPLPFTFQSPTGLAVIGDTLYVADTYAVWAIKPGQIPQELASLRSANSSGKPHILLAGYNENHLLLGLSTKTDSFRILQLDINTGQATLIGEDQLGRLTSLSRRSNADIWVGAENTLGPLGTTSAKFYAGQSISSMILPGQFTVPEDWPRRLDRHIIAAQTGPAAMRLIAIPTEFGQISGQPRVLLDGFMTRSNRSAWGSPGPMVMDKRGLFFADPDNGTLWRLSPKPKAQAKITIVDTADLPPAPIKEPRLTQDDKRFGIESTIKGTQIDTDSTIIAPSSIQHGSKLIKDYDEKKALEDAAKEDETPQKKRRMSRKRKQPNE